MSLDLITEIQASPKAFADKLTTMRAALDKAMGDWQETLKHNGSLIESNQMLRAALEAVTAQLAAVTAEREAARDNFLHASKQWQVTDDELNAARAEIDKLRQALEIEHGYALAANANSETNRAGWKDELESHKVTSALAARLGAEVARLTAALAAVVGVLREREWLTRHAAENVYCPSCSGDLWEDQTEHSSDCKFVAAMSQADAALRGQPAPAAPTYIYTGDTAPAQKE